MLNLTDLKKVKVAELKKALDDMGVDYSGLKLKKDLAERLQESIDAKEKEASAGGKGSPKKSEVEKGSESPKKGSPQKEKAPESPKKETKAPSPKKSVTSPQKKASASPKKQISPEKEKSPAPPEKPATPRKEASASPRKQKPASPEKEKAPSSPAKASPRKEKQAMSPKKTSQPMDTEPPVTNEQEEKQKVRQEKEAMLKEKLAKAHADRKAAEEAELLKTRPPSEYVHITNLLRPFTTDSLKRLLCEHGKLCEDVFFIDAIKSLCIAKFDSVDSATKTREAINGKTWPDVHGKELHVVFSSAEEFEKVSSTHERNVSRRNTADSSVRATNAEVETLDELFRKTKTKPNIYWLPLTEAQVQRKRAKLETSNRS
eukprot:Nk52_evm54s359 gene=Nk52_evmTU54s359